MVRPPTSGLCSELRTLTLTPSPNPSPKNNPNPNLNQVVLRALVALHAPELCALLAQPPPLASGGAREPPPQPPQPPQPTGAPSSSSNRSRRRPRAGGAYSQAYSETTDAIGHTEVRDTKARDGEARDSAWDAVVAPLATAAMMVPPPGTGTPSLKLSLKSAHPVPHSPPSSPSSSPRGCLRGCLPARHSTRHGALGTARRPAPNPPTAERAAAQPPLVFGWPPEGASGATEPTEAATLHRLLCAAQHAWRGHCTHERLASALVLKPAVGTAVGSGVGSGGGSSSGGSEAALWHGEVLLACAPLLLFASVSVESAATKQSNSRLKADEEEARERAVAGSVAAAVHEWSRPLSLVLAFLHRIRPSLEVLASSTVASRKPGP